jgi:hypothetical protein
MSSNSHIKIFVYSSSHLSEKHTIVSKFLRETEIIQDKTIVVRALGGKLLDDNVIYNAEEDVKNWPNSILIFLLGDNNLRKGRFVYSEFLKLVERVFKIEQKLNQGLIIWNGLIPNAHNWDDYQRHAVVIDREIKDMSMGYEKVAFVNLKSQFKENQWVSEYKILARDGVHFNELGGRAMADILANEAKAGVVRVRFALGLENFKLFERKTLKETFSFMQENIQDGATRSPVQKFEKPGCLYAHLADGTHVSKDTGEKFFHGCFAGSLEVPVGSLHIVRKEFVLGYPDKPKTPIWAEKLPNSD